MKYILLISFIFVLIKLNQCKEVKCSKKSFICYDATSYYECISDENGNYYNTRSLQTCRPGEICNDDNESECEENVSWEFLTDRKFKYKFGNPDGRKHIIDDDYADEE